MLRFLAFEVKFSAIKNMVFKLIIVTLITFVSVSLEGTVYQEGKNYLKTIIHHPLEWLKHLMHEL